jgi:hypothetical protein
VTMPAGLEATPDVTPEADPDLTEE